MEGIYHALQRLAVFFFVNFSLLKSVNIFISRHFRSSFTRRKFPEIFIHVCWQDVIHLVSISTPTEQFTRQRLDVFCLVRYSDQHLQPRYVLASILHRLPRRISEPGSVRGKPVGDYVHSCLLPSEHRQERAHVSCI